MDHASFRALARLLARATSRRSGPNSECPWDVALAFVDDELAGFAEVSVRSDHVEGTVCSPVPYLEGWYVRPIHRGRGVGRALISFVEQWAISSGFSELASDVALQNSHSIALHATLGFREVGRSVHFVKTLEAEIAKPVPSISDLSR